MSKRKSGRRHAAPPPIQVQSSLTKAQETLKKAKRCTYLIARGRIDTSNNAGNMRWLTVGSGFVAAPHRLITAAHVLNDPKKGPDFCHQDGDSYYLIRCDDEHNWHARWWQPKLNSEIFLYPDVDLAVMQLDEEFYTIQGRILNNKNDFLTIDPEFKLIGTEIGVLGYPLCALGFVNNDINTPNVANVLLRYDRGVINCRYRTSPISYLYEFTLSFNPGNSGGPIFDIESGNVISIVHGFKAHGVLVKESPIDAAAKGNLGIKNYPLDAFIEVIHASYSVGYATPSFVSILQQHSVI